ncbi:NAD/NADP octopine/nopaline dehydrogenase family protein [Phyllobacterium sp. 22552]|uniref:NAD/NADP octopine/nopaline dehydrogenase family protein n=1 Tax=Phyllobacterium sp. 22552 TaxID=3453941 RepID=UPI003F835D80
MRVSISGGGRTGHLYAVLFKQLPDVEVFWHSRKASEISENMPASGIQLISENKVIASGRPDLVSEDVTAVVNDADVVIFTQQNEGLPPTVLAASKHFNRTKATYVGVIPALGNAFDWLMQSAVPDNENVFVWGLRGVPATSPTMSLGKSVTLGGYKDILYLGFADNVPGYHRDKIGEVLQRLFPQPTVMLNSYLEMTLSPASLHPAVLYGIMGPYSQWDGSPLKTRLRWWADLSELSAYFLERCDSEIQTLIRTVELHLAIKLPNSGTIYGKQVEQYGSSIGDPTSLLTTFRTIPAHQSYIPLVEQPCGGFLFNTKHAGFRADLFYSMALYLELGRRLGLDLPYLKEIFEWGCDFIGERPHLAINYIPPDWLATEVQKRTGANH